MFSFLLRSYLLYNDFFNLCDLWIMVMREMRKKDGDEENEGWDHDDLDCPEYGEVINLKDNKEVKNERMASVRSPYPHKI
jgi:hypothetical protein